MMVKNLKSLKNYHDIFYPKTPHQGILLLLLVLFCCPGGSLGAFGALLKKFPEKMRGKK